MLDKDQVTNISTALMAIKDLSASLNVPINIHFSGQHIYVNVGFGTPIRKEMSFYPQDTYRLHSKTDDIYKWIEKMATSISTRRANPSGFMTKVVVADELHEVKVSSYVSDPPANCDIEKSYED